MGKRDTKAAKAKRAERRGKGALKTGDKTAKSEEKQQRRDANQQDNEDLEKVRAAATRSSAPFSAAAQPPSAPPNPPLRPHPQVLKELAALQASEAVAGEQVVPPPSPRVNSSLTNHPSGNELLVFGGELYDGKKNHFYSDLFRYSIKRNEWRLVSAKRSPPPRSSHQAVAVPSGGGSVFIFGGEFSSANQTQFYHYRDLWCLDLTTWKWEQVQGDLHHHRGRRHCYFHHLLSLTPSPYPPSLPPLSDPGQERSLRPFWPPHGPLPGPALPLRRLLRQPPRSQVLQRRLRV
jgi:hypothetical protein